jgi:hypothetical protein
LGEVQRELDVDVCLQKGALNIPDHLGEERLVHRGSSGDLLKDPS